jgi:alpha-beta hydrolase superfamily lysophospholipase
MQTGGMVEPNGLVVLLPGLAGHVEQFAGVTDGLAAVVVGHEWAPVPVTDFETVVTDLSTEVDKAVAAHPGLPLVLFGHGIGGMIAVRFAQRQPDRAAALVLSAPVLGPWQALDLLSDEEIPATTRYGPLSRGTLAAIDECLTTIDFDHPLGDHLPALWLHGDDDQLAPVSDTRAGMDRVRGLRFEERIYPGVGHDLLHGPIATTVAADVAEFVGRVGQAS